MLKGDCNKCIHKDLPVYSNTCMRCGISRKNYTPKTNGNRLRAMTDEELAKKISGIESFALTCGGSWPPEKWLDWLRQETKA